MPKDQHVTEIFLGAGLRYGAEQYSGLAGHQKQISARDAHFAEEASPTALDDAIRGGSVSGIREDTGANSYCDQTANYEKSPAFHVCALLASYCGSVGPFACPPIRDWRSITDKRRAEFFGQTVGLLQLKNGR
jgi:hypothetical protein